MNTVIQNYNKQIKKFQKIKFDSTENEIHDKRVILRRIFPMLAAFKIKPSKVKNGEKAFKLFGKLRDIQVQILKLEKTEQIPEITDYLTFLKEKELNLKNKVRKFCKKKELEFPSIRKKSTLDKAKIINKTNKSLNKLIEIINSHSIDDAEDIHKIRIEFKKFRYKVEILSYIENIDESKLDLLKIYQDMLGEIQDYEVLIDGIKKYCKKRKLEEDEMTEVFEKDQDRLIENFDEHIESFILVCRDVICLNNEVESSDDWNNLGEAPGIDEAKHDSTNDIVGSANEQVTENSDVVIPDIEQINENKEADNSEAEKVNEDKDDSGLNNDEVNSKKQKEHKAEVHIDSDHSH